MNQKKLQGAFSFIEILVVVTIIGIITTIGLVTYTEFLKQSRDAKRKGDMEQIRGALEMYRSKNNAYPLSLTFGTGNICDPAPGDCSTGTYLSRIPNDPRDDLYTYVYSSDGTTYSLGTMLERTPTNPSTTCSGCTLGSGAACNYCMGPFGQLQ